jgi:hypothetical protein
MKNQKIALKALIVLNVLLVGLNACKEVTSTHDMDLTPTPLESTNDREGNGTNNNLLATILSKKGITLERESSSSETLTGCNCEIRVNSISGQVSEWSLTQSLLCSNTVSPIFSSEFGVCCNPCGQDQIGVWKPFNCTHPRNVLNTMFFQSWYFGDDTCAEVLNYAIGGAPCSKDYFNYPATASVTIRCQTTRPPNDVPVGPQGPYYVSETFSLSSNQGPNPCETLGTLGTAKFSLNKYCWPVKK